MLICKSENIMEASKLTFPNVLVKMRRFFLVVGSLSYILELQNGATFRGVILMIAGIAMLCVGVVDRLFIKY